MSTSEPRHAGGTLLAAGASSPAPAAPGTADPRAWWRVAPALAVLAWGGNQFTPLLLMYRQTDGYSQLQVDLMLAFYVVGLAPTFVLSGPLSDRFGRRPLVLAGLLVGALASAVLAVGSSSVVWMCAGRMLSGASVAVAMVVGTIWVEELSRASRGSPRPAGAAARRASMTLTVGFGAGAGVGGVLAQWGPHPTVVPYLVQIALSALAAAPATRAADTRPAGRAGVPVRVDLRVPTISRRRFVGLVVPLAPWVFGTAGLAYALTPSLVASRAGHEAVAFATLLTVITLAVGTVAQQLAPTVARWTRHRTPLAGIAVCAVGVALCAVEATARSLPLAVVIAVVLGAGYGLCMISGLVEVRTMADEEQLGGLTGIYYGLTYSGFALPAILAAASGLASYRVLLLVLTAVCLLCALSVGHSLAVTHQSRGPGRAGAGRAS